MPRRLRPFNEPAAFEAGPGADQRDEVGCVHRPPPLLGGLDELEDHGRGGGRAAAPRVTLVRSRTVAAVAKVGSIGFVVHRWIQCSAGKS